MRRGTEKIHIVGGKELRPLLNKHDQCVKCRVSFSEPGVKKRGRYCHSCKHKRESVLRRLRKRAAKGKRISHKGHKVHYWCTNYYCLNKRCPHHDKNYVPFSYNVGDKRVRVPKLTKEFRECPDAIEPLYPYQLRKLEEQKNAPLGIHEEYTE